MNKYLKKIKEINIHSTSVLRHYLALINDDISAYELSNNHQYLTRILRDLNSMQRKIIWLKNKHERGAENAKQDA